MNFIIFILFVVLVCGHLASESASEIVKDSHRFIIRSPTVFIGRKNYKGELDMKNIDNDKFFIAQKLPKRDGFQDWVLKEGNETIGSVQEACLTDVSKGARVLYTCLDGQLHSRMHRENGSYILEHLKSESSSANKTIGTKCRWFCLYSAITMEPGSDTNDNFATFVMFFLLQFLFHYNFPIM